jgi:hypothetical protein
VTTRRISEAAAAEHANSTAASEQMVLWNMIELPLGDEG